MAMTQEQFPFEYHQLLWGEVIYGSKQQLQTLGIAPDTLFPGEPGQNRRKLECLDPRGLQCSICQKSPGENYYICSIYYPDREPCPAPLPPELFAPGVLRSMDVYWFDEYVGDADSLVAAGLVGPGLFPGFPGMRKTCVTLLPDGTPLGGAPTANPPAAAKAPGARYVTKAGRKAYRVCVRLTAEEWQTRYDAKHRREAEHTAWLQSLPRPRPLVAPDREAAARDRRQVLRLVWSRPAPTFTLTP